LIYFDNAATTGVKPASVRHAVERALVKFNANPGRGGHDGSVLAGEMVYSVRKKTAEFFGCDNPSNVIFTASCTVALNTAIKGILKTGDHAVISCLEHNAVYRPIVSMKQNGVSFDNTKVYSDEDETVRSFEKLFKSNTRAVVCTHASNVFGTVLPVKKLGAMCREKGIALIVDAAQTAGVLPVSMSDMGISCLCIAPHKGLYAPMGTGILISDITLAPLIHGGTGVNSMSPMQPDEMPERLESGTVNLPGIAGIGSGIDFVRGFGMEKIHSVEIQMVSRIYDYLKSDRRFVLYTERPNGNCMPVLSFNIKNRHSEVVADRLNKNGIAVRAGLHCAPLAHKSMGTIGTGTVRICPSVFNNGAEVDRVINVLKKI